MWPTLQCSSSIRTWRFWRTRRADSRLAMRRLMRLRSPSLSWEDSGSPLYVTGRPSLLVSFFGTHLNGLLAQWCKESLRFRGHSDQMSTP